MIDASAFIHPKAHVEGSRIGPRTKVWQFASVIRGSVIGADCKIASTSIVDGCLWFSAEELMSGGLVITNIEDGASIGASAVILPGLRIGKGSMIAAGAVVTRSVAPNSLCRRDRTVIPITEGMNQQRKFWVERA
jgi:UDP-2-acetamido-3-amino-2,3-dideoxy-glucuronate N-acetyltransferase